MIPAIPEESRDEVLQSLGLLEPMVEGSLKCDVCGDIVTLHNLALLRIVDGQFIFACDKPSCMLSFGTGARKPKGGG